MKTATPKQWQNWSGSVTATPSSVIYPDTLQQLSDIVCQAIAPLRFVGSGHSFSPLVQSNGTILDLSAFAGLRYHDAKQLTATIGAGTRLSDLEAILFDIQQALPNMGDIDRQTMAGALGTATHGTGLTLGAYHTQLTSMTFVDGTGEVKEFSIAKEQELIHATGVSLGAFGALTAVTIQNVPPYRLHRKRKAIANGDMLNEFERLMKGHRSVEFFVLPFSGYSLYLTSELSDLSLTSRPADQDEDGLKTLKILRDTLYWFPWLRRKLIGTALSKVPEEDYVQDWLNVYASNRTFRFNEMEYHLPLEYGAKALGEIMTMLEKQFPRIYFPIEVRTVAADEFWLSPFYQRLTCSIAIHHDASEDHNAFFNAAEAVFRRYQGRPHWGKIHNLTANDFSKLYPRWKDAMEVRRSMDPKGLFISPYLKRILE